MTLRTFLTLLIATTLFVVSVDWVRPFLGHEEHQFDRQDPRVWLLVRGTLLERIGLIDPIEESIEYSTRFQTLGSDALQVSYDSYQPPDAIIASYEFISKSLNLKFKFKNNPSIKESEPYNINVSFYGQGQDVEIHASSSSAGSHVSVLTYGSL